MKINPCVIGLGYVGLPIILHLASKFSSHGFDINTNRIYNKINANKKYDVILFLSNHEKFKKKFKNILLSKNRNNILDPFRYFS